MRYVETILKSAQTESAETTKEQRIQQYLLNARVSGINLLQGQHSVSAVAQLTEQRSPVAFNLTNTSKVPFLGGIMLDIEGKDQQVYLSKFRIGRSFVFRWENDHYYGRVKGHQRKLGENEAAYIESVVANGIPIQR